MRNYTEWRNAMAAEQRKSNRRPIGTRAWADFGPDARMHQCFIKDMSDTGARLAMALSVPVPPEFVLQFSPDGSVGRRCEVRWRSGIEIGVKFTARIMNGRVIEFASLDC
jgi:PilZ domain